MIFTLNKRIGSMAIVLDEEKELTAFLPVDRLAMLAHGVDNLDGVCHFKFAFGGLDPKGKFHADKAREGVRINIARPPDPGSFDALFTDSKGNHRADYSLGDWITLSKDLLLKCAYQIEHWEKFMPDVEIIYGGAVLLKAVKGSVIDLDKQRVSDV
jgi:hypothetical protein